MERILHYVWKYKLYATDKLYTTENLPVTVIDPGIHNGDAGPDFFNAKIKIGETLWAGSVELHCRSSDWYKHGHQNDKNYETVILHVVEIHDKEVYGKNHTPIPHLILPVPENICKNIDWLLQQEKTLPCLHAIKEIDPIYIYSWLGNLVNERLERKTKDIFRLLEKYKEDWNEVFYITLCRNFGFGINNDAFEWLATHLPFRYILKQRGSSSQIESMLLGQAGLLNEKLECHYYSLLQKEYQFLKYKFGLETNENYFYKCLRTRPVNFPHVKLAQLAAIFTQHDNLFTHILHTADPEQLKKFFQVPPSDYWLTHYHFRYASAEKNKILGENSIRIILINTVIPILFAYAQHTRQIEYSERALSILESLPAEKNHITSLFEKAGIIPQHAGESQALIQLKKEYCDQKKCLYCQIGFRLLKRSTSF